MSEIKTFTLDEEQTTKFDKWRKEKKDTLPQAAIGGAYSYIFTPTGIGTIVVVECVDGTKLDLTKDFN